MAKCPHFQIDTTRFPPPPDSVEEWERVGVDVWMSKRIGGLDWDWYQRKRKQYMRSDAWKWRRDVVRKHTNMTCELCGFGNDSIPNVWPHVRQSGIYFVVHHETYDNMFMESFDDLIGLCNECHMALHEIEGYHLCRRCREIGILDKYKVCAGCWFVKLGIDKTMKLLKFGPDALFMVYNKFGKGDMYKSVRRKIDLFIERLEEIRDGKPSRLAPKAV